MSYQTILALSGGVSSAVLLSDVSKQGNPADVLCVFLAYGQRSYGRDSIAACALAEAYACDYRYLELGPVFERSGCAIFDGDVPPDRPLSAACFVPVLVSLCGQLAVALGAKRVALGVCADDRSLPDRKPEALVHLEATLRASSEGTVKLYSPFADWTGAQVVRYGAEIGVDFAKTWSCYKGTDRPCGLCHKCQARRQAFAANKLEAG